MRATLKLSRFETFQREYELAARFMLQPDFAEGVSARLIKRTVPQWSLPASTLSQPQSWVQSEILENYRFNETLSEEFYLLERRVQDKVYLERSIFKYSLPMEVSVLATLMKGRQDVKGLDEGMFTRKELVDYIIGERLGRAGAERKLNHILDRKTIEDANGKLVWKFEGENSR